MVYIVLDPPEAVVVPVNVATETNTTVTGVAIAEGDTITVTVPPTVPSPGSPDVFGPVVVGESGTCTTLTTVVAPAVVVAED